MCPGKTGRENWDGSRLATMNLLAGKPHHPVKASAQQLAGNDSNLMHSECRTLNYNLGLKSETPHRQFFLAMALQTNLQPGN